jgi:hypothetical protein
MEVVHRFSGLRRKRGGVAFREVKQTFSKRKKERKGRLGLKKRGREERKIEGWFWDFGSFELFKTTHINQKPCK